MQVIDQFEVARRRHFRSPLCSAAAIGGLVNQRQQQVFAFYCHPTPLGYRGR